MCTYKYINATRIIYMPVDGDICIIRVLVYICI